MREWVRQEYLLPSLVIGLDEDKFWTLTPKTIQIYFEAERQKQKNRVQEIWLMGAYFKQALSSTILVAGIADKNSASKMPKFPVCPSKEVEEIELTEKQKCYERARLVQYLNRFSKR